MGTSNQHSKTNIHLILMEKRQRSISFFMLCPNLLLILSTDPIYRVDRTSSATSMVRSMSSSVCARDMKPASYREGAR